MIFTPQIDPVIFSIGPVAVRWYSLMYIVALLIAIGLGNYRAKKPGSTWTKENVSDAAFYLFIGAVLGGRVGYAIFYGWEQVLQNPLFILGWNGHTVEWSGMSFHGGLLGTLVAALLVRKKIQKSFWQITDFFAPLLPLGLFFGRIGNFINGELWGKYTDQTWGVLFEHAPVVNGLVYRHPSQLYEAITEGLLLFIALWWYTNKPRPRCAASGLFLAGYGIARFIVEFFREPDAHLGYRLGTDWLTTGMILCIPMIVAGLGLMIYAYRNNKGQ
ncbi:prolipoprotein diacylglyceryl transferase [Wohlfahrtiimonas chitiniclastica]|uniref:prolipoprotein diacylglyceryl transferase n=1 Tax=Wohlfahrtiimonas chitiniclastica TaxID=400946 RepID=UPI001BCC6423|nr:prolipoprotein diacylglyceryl transferase [Wohlfahrtiimonas chitiniclastica]MBS7834977.1 prolipoprotein diacylglyceryl transferase [Wohlfahrtiimonas chitiniclastica]